MVALGKAHYRYPGRLFDVGDFRQMMWEGGSKVTMEKPLMKCKNVQSTQNCHLLESKQDARLSPREAGKISPALGAVHGYSHVLKSPLLEMGLNILSNSIIRQAL